MEISAFSMPMAFMPTTNVALVIRKREHITRLSYDMVLTESEYVEELITNLGSVAWQAVNVPTNNKRARIVSVSME